MKKILALLLISICCVVHARTNLSDEEIKQRIIQESIAAYPGNCPCPYNLARNGSQCGARSAYSKPGGRSPICFPTDVTPQMIQSHKIRMR